MDNDLQIGEKIRKQRIKANLTQEKLAEYSDLSINFISKLERGQKKNISILILNAICRALEISDLRIASRRKQYLISTFDPSSLQLIHELQTLDRPDCESISQHILLLLDDFKNDLQIKREAVT